MSYMDEVWIDDFDRGLIESLGATIHQYTVDEGVRSQWAIDFREFPVSRDANDNVVFRDFGVIGPSQFNGSVPVYFVIGQPAFTPKILPAIVVRRNSVEPALENGHGAFSVLGRPANSAREMSVTLSDGTVKTGYSRYEVKPRAIPYNISYDISIRSRGDSAQQQGNRMYRALSRIIEPRGFEVRVRDSAGDERGYDAFVESVSPNIEMLDLTGRGAGWTLSVIVHGELDHSDPYDVPALTSVPTTTLQTN